MTPPIHLADLHKHFGDVKAVDGVSLDVEQGEIFGFLGPNGAGKSTTIRTLLGFLHPTSGTAQVLGTDSTDRAGMREVKTELGYLPSDVQFPEGVTGQQALDYYAGLKGDERREDLLADFPVPLDRKIKTYSRGNRQKLAIVQAFMHEPDLLVMDEPTAGLDPLVQERFYDFLDREVDRGATVFFSTHILSEVRRMCERVAIIREGQLVTVEEIDDLLRKSGKVVHVQSPDHLAPDDFRFEGVASVEAASGGLRLLVTGNYDELLDRLTDYHVTDLEMRETAIEDVFMHFYDEGTADTPEAMDSDTVDPTDPDGDPDAGQTEEVSPDV
ncbi:ABC transporter ATP-binding protein [Salinirubrum litoreum]|uniref:ABC transporter ATP-binding protein n=1 Tax=Salinirubrum litoreum TaxID=1126234 RepID=A0ABD5RBC2_9EURY